MVRPTPVLLVLIALALIVNPIWFFPAEGETRYTYTRVPVEVDNGSLVYKPPDDGSGGRFNDLEGIGCDYNGNPDLPRGCAFDRYLLDDGPVTMAGGNDYSFRPEFVYLNGSYYKRIERNTTNGHTFDVVQTKAGRVRRELARDAVALPTTPDASSSGGLVSRDGTVRSSVPPQDHVLGQIYRLGDGYYTVALVETTRFDHSLVSPVVRFLLDIAGGGLLALAGYRVGAS